MKMTVETALLLKSLRQVESAVQERGYIPATRGILFNVDKTVACICATDLENTLQTEVVCEADEKGEFLVNGKKLVGLVSKITEEKIVFEKSESGLNITAGSSEYKLLTMDTEEFPKIPAVAAGMVINLTGEQFLACLRSISFCIDPDEPRPHFRGVLLDILPDRINMVGTDTKQLAINSIEIKNEKQTKVLIPVKSVSIFQKSLGNDNMEIHISKNAAFVKQGVLEITSQLLAGSEDYPKYDTVIPKETALQFAEIPVKPFLSALNRLAVILTERYQKVIYTFSKNKLLLEHFNPESGNAREELAITFGGEETKVALNPSILAFLSKIAGDTVKVGVKDGKTPLLLKGDADKGLFITMPLKMDE